MTALYLTGDDAEWLERLLREQAGKEQEPGTASVLLGRLCEVREQERLRDERLAAEGVVASGVLLPLLERAAQDGTYVRSAYHRDGERGPWVALPGGSETAFYWAGALRALDARGVWTQMVYSENGRGGAHVEGYRLAPDGAEARSVAERDVWAAGGRCRLCGAEKDAAAGRLCPRAGGHGQWGHEFAAAVL